MDKEKEKKPILLSKEKELDDVMKFQSKSPTSKNGFNPCEMQFVPSISSHPNHRLHTCFTCALQLDSNE